ncbi:MAG: putative D-xylose utilization operon transcriptional repressor [Anaerolineales bacterium]|nr:putative D-xylose utilization operon transcriptional repressor [Anaerolineales bacterium]
MNQKRKLDFNNSSDSLSQTIYKEIRERISLLQYPPGTVLSENALAAEFEVSRTPIRRVLQRLELDGLVLSKRGIGTMVTTVDLKSLKEVYALRMKLHEITGELSSVAHLTNDDIASLENVLEQCDEMLEQRDPEKLARLYNTFQEQIVRHINNEPLREVSDRLYYQTCRVWLQILPDMDWSEEVDVMRDEVSQVIEALRAGDMHTVGQVRRDHLFMMLGRIKRYLGGATEAELDAVLPSRRSTNDE